MKITDVKTMLLTYVCPPQDEHHSDFGRHVAYHAAVVVVETDEGIKGYGEAKGDPDVMKAAIEKHLKPMLVGKDPTQVEYLWELMYNGSRIGLTLKYGRPHPVLGHLGEYMCAVSGVDIALWDVTGKAMGVPIYKLMGGGYRNKIRAYASGGWAPRHLAAEELSGYVAKGFNAVKMRVGGIDEPNQVRGSLARVEAVREALGPDVDIMVDSHGSFGATLGLKFAVGAEDYNLAWFEEPCTSDDVDGLARLRGATTIPIAAGENEFSRFGFRNYIEKQALDIFQPDAAICGGLTESKRIANLAYTWNIQMAPHVWGSGLLFAASLQLAAAIPNYYIFEFCQAPNPLFSDLFTESLKVGKDGFVDIPNKPGLGFELQPDLEKRFPYVAQPERVAG